MDRWLERDIVVRIVAVVLAVGLWLSVTTAERADQVQRSFEGVEVRVSNVPSGAAVAALDPETISVVVRGEARDLNRFSREDFTAWVNLQGPARMGATEYVIDKVSVPRGVTLLEYTPVSVEVLLEEVVEDARAVGVIMNGQPAAGYTTAQPVVTPSEVVLRGPGSLLENITAVWVAVDISDSDSDILQQLPVILVDDQGQPVTGVQTVPQLVEVRVPIREVQGTKTVPVEPAITGRPASGFQTGEVNVVPSEVVISGPERILQEIQSLSTAPIDLSGASSPLEQEVALVIPQGIQANPATVAVRVRIDQSISTP